MARTLWIRKALTSCVFAALLTTSSMVALANSGRIAAELTVSGDSVNGQAPIVMVNGEAANSGRSIFPSSTITTPHNTSAIVSMGKAGRIELAPDSSLNLTFDDNTVTGDLTSGQLTALGSLGTVNIRTVDGKTTTLTSGETIHASGKAQTTTSASNNWWILGIVAVAAVVIVAVAVSQGGDDDVVSPVR